ncbi:MAG: histidine--tRNA ligase [Firmicutes bacterium]|nr:histidine--tRNA ligase [Bacillota bacterium]
MEARAPRGTSDILPGEARLWQEIEATVRDVMRVYGYGEIRTPVFEYTELFERGVGETTDIVEKQMYTFEDRGGRSLTLRPEGTAPVVRAFVQHRLHGEGLPQKLWYCQPMFRYERPQAGRARQFHQFGAEAIGSLDPALDVEMIAIPIEVYKRLGIRGFEVLVNSIGCPVCRPAYRERLKAYLAQRIDRLCPTCRARFERNPLRVLDCKEEGCREATAGAPAAWDYLCDECGLHFESVQRVLAVLGIAYRLDGRLVRGLDYYTKTVFEIVTDGLGAQGTLAAGGRYDGLAAELGGGDYPAVGFAGGMERAVLALKAAGREEGKAQGRPDVFVVRLGERAWNEGIALAQRLREHGVAAQIEYAAELGKARSMKAQMKVAGRSGARLAVIAGDDELSRGTVALRRMDDGTQWEVPVERLVDAVKEQLGGGGRLA